MKFKDNGLPEFKDLDIITLGRSFKNVSNSYKFYWFLAILDHLTESEDPLISLDELALRMLSSVWYPLDYYKLSFGKQDSFKNLAATVTSFMIVDNRPNAPSLFEQVEKNLPKDIANKLKYSIKIVLKRWVTFRFLTPFYSDQLKGVRDQQANDIIKHLSNDAGLRGYAPYVISSESILLNENWKEYFKTHQTILRGFIKYYLIEFLQKNNPTVVGLSEKLEKPHFRDLKSAKLFWGKFIATENTTCIFSNNVIPIAGYSLDHFIPWSYVAHDQIWNIIPTTKSVNSSKSDSLPDLNLYLNPFCEMQFRAVNFQINSGNNKILEDYYSLFRVSDLIGIDEDSFKKTLSLEIINSQRVAENLGFKPNYCYRP